MNGPLFAMRDVNFFDEILQIIETLLLPFS